MHIEAKMAVLAPKSAGSTGFDRSRPGQHTTPTGSTSPERSQAPLIGRLQTICVEGPPSRGMKTVGKVGNGPGQQHRFSVLTQLQFVRFVQMFTIKAQSDAMTVYFNDNRTWKLTI